jgi:L-2-hydroxycarboxylate dehydrogenase (NAD+)
MAEATGAGHQRIAHADLVRFIAAAYRAARISAAEAEKAAELMAASEISGADGHGVFRLPQYIRRIKAGGLNTKPEITVIRRTRATALVDGDNGLGSLVVARAVEEAIGLRERAGSAGPGCGAAITPAPPRSMPRCRCSTT